MKNLPQRLHTWIVLTATVIVVGILGYAKWHQQQTAPSHYVLGTVEAIKEPASIKLPRRFTLTRNGIDSHGLPEHSSSCRYVFAYVVRIRADRPTVPALECGTDGFALGDFVPLGKDTYVPSRRVGDAVRLRVRQNQAQPGLRIPNSTTYDVRGPYSLVRLLKSLVAGFESLLTGAVLIGTCVALVRRK